MRLLLATHVLLWTIAGHARVECLRDRITDDDNEIFVSTVSYWEVALSPQLAHVEIDAPALRRAVRESGFLELPMLGSHTDMLSSLAPIHEDPYERMLVAQAHAEPMRLLTTNSLLIGYGPHVEVI